MTAEEIKAKIEAAPEIIPCLKRVAKHAVAGPLMPKIIQFGTATQTPASFVLLNRILLGRCFYKKGHYYLITLRLGRTGILRVVGGAGTGSKIKTIPHACFSTAFFVYFSTCAKVNF